MTPTILVNPEISLVSEEVLISVDGLLSEQNYRIELRLLHKTGTYRSFGVFKANSAGSIDLQRDTPIRGTYSEKNCGGLFETVEPTENVRFGGYCNCTPPVDFKYHLLVIGSHNEVVCEKLFSRKLMHPLVERIEIEKALLADSPISNVKINNPKVTGTLFKPPGNGPFPTIIDISGTGGGINEQKGALLASRGFVVLCLAFFRYKNLPEELFNVDLQYFEDAINYMISLPYTSDRIGFQGVSFGGTLVMFLATKFPQIKAVVSINGSTAFDEFAHIKINGKTPALGSRLESGGGDIKFINGLMVYFDMVRNLKVGNAAKFQLENSASDTAFRFVSSLDDLSTPTIYATNLLSDQLRGLRRKVDVDFLPGGHLMDPPCFPHHPMVFSSMAGLFQMYGGEASLHGKSQFGAWERTVRFFSEHLGQPIPLPDFLRFSAKL